jgi:hypothetical protein
MGCGRTRAMLCAASAPYAIRRRPPHEPAAEQSARVGRGGVTAAPSSRHVAKFYGNFDTNLPLLVPDGAADSRVPGGPTGPLGTPSRTP